jgi:ankyrin repeat protein
MSRITRELTPRKTLDSLRKQAKRWLKDIEAGDEASLARFRDVFPSHAGKPKLREVQHALSHEFGFVSWAALKQEIEDRTQSHAQRIELFLEKAVHRYGTDPRTGKWGAYERDGETRGAIAARLLSRHPEIARDSIHTAILAHDIDVVRAFLAKDASLASQPHPFDGWRPLMRLAYARLPLPHITQTALPIANLLLDAGADPSGAAPGDLSGFRTLTGVIGEGEGGQSPHPQAEEFARLLIARGADPLDGQALYNTSLGADSTFWLDFMWSACDTRGDDMAKRWHTDIPGVIGPPLEYLLGNAVPRHPKRAAWLLAHGADANTANSYSKEPVIKHALLGGRQDVIDLLAKHGARMPELSVVETFCATVARGDEAETRRLAAQSPEVLTDFGPLLIAAGSNNVEVATLLLDLGVSPDIAAVQNFRPLHTAAQSGSVDVAKLLIARGAEIDPIETRYKSTPLGHAVYQKRSGMIALLAPLSRDIASLCWSGSLDRLQELLTEDPSLVNRPGRWGEPPLFCLPDDDALAAEVVEALLAHGADSAVKNAEGLTPAEAARKRGLEDTAALLEP